MEIHFYIVLKKTSSPVSLSLCITLFPSSSPSSPPIYLTKEISTDSNSLFSVNIKASVEKMTQNIYYKWTGVSHVRNETQLWEEMRVELIIIDQCWEGIIFTIISRVISGGARQIKKHRFKKGPQVVVYSLLTMYVTGTCIREGKKS